MSSEAVGDAAQSCCVFLTLQFDYFWALLQKTSLADVDSPPPIIKCVGLCTAGCTLYPQRAICHVHILHHIGYHGFAGEANTESIIAAAWYFDSVPPEVNYLQHPSICYCSAVISSFSLY